MDSKPGCWWMLIARTMKEVVEITSVAERTASADLCVIKS
jgi:hypothetical protein